MKQDRKLQTFLIVALMLVVVAMSIGFAAFSQNLTINGTATVKSAKWDVRFDTATYAEAAGSVAATTHSITDTSATYTVTLNNFGDYYEFTVDAKNYGTIDAHLSSITMSTLTTEQAKYLTYTITYGGTDYTASASGLNVALNATASSTVKVRVEYIQPTDQADLPATDQNVTLTATLNYQQTV
jgi:hypothetical protein